MRSRMEYLATNQVHVEINLTTEDRTTIGWVRSKHRGTSALTDAEVAPAG